MATIMLAGMVSACVVDDGSELDSPSGISTASMNAMVIATIRRSDYWSGVHPVEVAPANLRVEQGSVQITLESGRSIANVQFENLNGDCANSLEGFAAGHDFSGFRWVARFHLDHVGRYGSLTETTDLIQGDQALSVTFGPPVQPTAWSCSP